MIMDQYLNWWVVTDLDGTLLDHNYDLSPAIDLLNYLKSIGVPVIPCTSKTASEVKKLRNQYDLIDPYIVENGGAIYGDIDHKLGEWELALGRRHDDLRPLLDRLSEELEYPLRALKDTVAEEKRRTNHHECSGTYC